MPLSVWLTDTWNTRRGQGYSKSGVVPEVPGTLAETIFGSLKWHDFFLFSPVPDTTGWQELTWRHFWLVSSELIVPRRQYHSISSRVCQFQGIHLSSTTSRHFSRLVEQIQQSLLYLHDSLVYFAVPGARPKRVNQWWEINKYCTFDWNASVTSLTSCWSLIASGRVGNGWRGDRLPVESNSKHSTPSHIQVHKYKNI